MPELPEVERFRQILLPLVTVPKRQTLKLELYGEKLPRKWVSAEDVDSNTGKWCCADVLRKGKQLCMVLETKKTTDINESPKKYFYLHMGMTGRLVSPSMSCSWGHKYIYDDPNEEWPPKFTYLILTSGKEKVAFADPRKFGACKFSDSLDFLDELAPDGLIETCIPSQCQSMAAAIMNQRLGIKALILDQKRAVSGVGNWVADEVLYQCELHPDQSYLTNEQALDVVGKLHSILSIAVDCLNDDIPYPEKWLFGFRWTKKKAGKDYLGRNLSFLQSGGRTSAIVASIQKLRSVGKKSTSVTAKSATKKKKIQTKKNVSIEGSETKSSDAVEVTLEEKIATKTDQKPDVVVSKKRKVGITPEEVHSVASSISTVSRAKLTKKKQQAKKCKIKPKIKREFKQEHEERHKDETSLNITRAVSDSKDISMKYDTEERKFRLEKETMLNQVDKSVKDDFRKVGFAKWQRQWLPVIQLGPYDISPGPVRKYWMDFFHKRNEAPRLVYWYGSPKDDLSKSFSFLSKNTIVSYDEGVKQSRHELSAKIKKKLLAGKQLTVAEKVLVKGLTELKDESEMSKENRLSWMKIED